MIEYAQGSDGNALSISEAKAKQKEVAEAGNSIYDTARMVKALLKKVAVPKKKPRA
jgi:hypothetical protein